MRTETVSGMVTEIVKLEPAAQAGESADLKTVLWAKTTQRIGRIHEEIRDTVQDMNRITQDMAKKFTQRIQFPPVVEV